MEDVEQLHPTADREHGDVGCHGLLEQSPLYVVALRVGRLRARIGRCAVTRRVDIGAAGQEQSGQTIQGWDAGLGLKRYGFESYRAQSIGVRLRLLREPKGESDSFAPIVTSHALTFYRDGRGAILKGFSPCAQMTGRTREGNSSGGPPPFPGARNYWGHC